MPRAKKNNRGRPPVFPEMESKLMEWIADRRQQGIGISIVEVRLQAKLMAKSEPSDSDSDDENTFKGFR